MSRFWPLFISAVVFFVVLATGGTILNLAEQRRVDDRLHAIREIGTAQAHILENHLNQALSATFALASVLWQQGSIYNFAALAELRKRRLTATH